MARYNGPVGNDIVLNADQHWWDRRMSIICETIQFLLIPFDDIHTENNVDLMYENKFLIDNILETHPQPVGYKKCISLLLQGSPLMAVQILKSPEMRPILEGAFYQGMNLEEKIKRSWSYVKTSAGIGDAKFDALVVPHFKFLNEITGFKFISSGKTLRKHFNEETSKYNITEINSPQGCGAIFDLIQSVNMEFENKNLRKIMTIKEIGTSGDLLIPQLVGLDSANVRGRSHTKFTTIHRSNGAYQHALQNYNTAYLEGWYFGSDSNLSNYKNFVQPLIEYMHYLEENFKDPLSGQRIEMPFFFLLMVL